MKTSQHSILLTIYNSHFRFWRVKILIRPARFCCQLLVWVCVCVCVCTFCVKQTWQFSWYFVCFCWMVDMVAWKRPRSVRWWRCMTHYIMKPALTSTLSQSFTAWNVLASGRLRFIFVTFSSPVLDLESHNVTLTETVSMAQNRPLWRLLFASGAVHS